MTASSRSIPKALWGPTVLYGVVFVAAVVEWLQFDVEWMENWMRLIVFATGLPLIPLWWRQLKSAPPPLPAAVATLAILPIWAVLTLGADVMGQAAWRAGFAQFGLGTVFLVGLGWSIWWVDRQTKMIERRRLLELLAAAEAEGRHGDVTPTSLEQGQPAKRIWNPYDPWAWYYGRRGRKLNQSLTTLFSYSLLFLLAYLVITQTQGCQEIYESPAGGGKDKMAQTKKVQIQKVIKKKFIINPFSNIIFNPPPIEQVQLQLQEITQHQYAIGQGDGDDAGFTTGTKRGKVRFIRLEYAGGDWNQDFGIGADVNMLNEYHIRTKHPCHNETESRSIPQLKNFLLGKSPPFVYMTGQRNIQLSDNEIKILREYLIEKHGMIFADNGGSRHWHNQFVAMMSRVLEGKVEPVVVPLDDYIHQHPYSIPFLPFVAPHGGKEALGWKVEGRWVCYYHPGDIGDAWADDHAGVRSDVAEYCYQLGTNVIYYAHAEYDKWASARNPKKK